MSSLKSPAPLKRFAFTQVFKKLSLILVAAPMLALSLTGCAFQPLYGTTASGTSLNEVMKSVKIQPIPGRVGQKLRNELIFQTTGGGSQPVTEYTLEVAVRESVRAINVEISGDSQGQIYMLDTKFKLVRAADGKTVFEGSSSGRAAFDKFDSIFANTRARIDAEGRAAKTVADSIKTRIAAYLSRTV